MDLEGAVVVGIDFVTLSSRALVVRVADGAELEVMHRLGDLRRDLLTAGERS